MTFTEGQRVLVDRSLHATFIRKVDDFNAIIQVGADTRLVDLLSLGEEEA